MISFKNIFLKILCALFFLTAGICQAGQPMTPVFVNGVNRPLVKICSQQIKASSCKLNSALSDYQNCVKKVLLHHSACKQSLAFFQLTNGGVIDKVRSYKNIDVILANYVYIADQGTGYFLVLQNGQLMNLPLVISQKMIKTAPGYISIAKHYPHVEAWQITAFPTAETKSTFYRLIFTQELKDGCNACAIAGTAKVAYDFTLDGKKFLGLKILKLLPKPAH